MEISNEEKRLITEAYNPAQFQNYKKIYAKIAPEDKRVFSCGCEAQKLYLLLKNKYEELQKTS